MRRRTSDGHARQERRPKLRRRSIILGSASLLLLPGARASAQPPRRRPKVAFLIPTAPDSPTADRVRAELAELGYMDGQTVSLEARFAHHRLERLPALAAELVAGQPDVIYTFTSPAAYAIETPPRLSQLSWRPSPSGSWPSSSATWSAQRATSQA